MEKDEKNDLIIKKFVKIEFGSRRFFLPLSPANVCFEKKNILSIDLADMDEYVLVDGLRCYYCVIYDAENDTVSTWLKDITIDGLTCPGLTYLSFPLSAHEFAFSKRDPRPVVPIRDYSELTAAFLRQHPELDGKIVHYLEEHPESFEQASMSEWFDLNVQLSMDDCDPECFPETVSELFRKVVK